MASYSAPTRNQEATLYIGNLDEKTTESILWELFLQAGPVINVHIPKDRVTSQHQGYGFVEFQTPEDADYASKILNLVKLYGKPLRVNKSSQDRKMLDVGATLFIGNLAPEVDEKLLNDTFSTFGVLVETPKVSRDSESGVPKGFGFVSFDSFESADSAISCMDGQWLANKRITVAYSFKKDGKGERHGSAAERLLAQQGKKVNLANSTATVSAAAGMPPPPAVVPMQQYQ
jgi:splicing factor 3B subunit 4